MVELNIFRPTSFKVKSKPCRLNLDRKARYMCLHVGRATLLDVESLQKAFPLHLRVQQDPTWFENHGM